VDEVDRILAAWQGEAPGLDVTPLAVFSRVSRLARHLELTRREAFEAQGLDVWEFDVLAALRRAGSPYQLSPGALIHETLSTSGTMTNRIDRLTARGLVERLPDPRDGRRVRVRLTTAGRAAVEAALSSLVAHERRLLEVLSADEVTQIAALLRTLLLPFEGKA
jgi:DNA-binding MarR family transcriptional regulator